MKRGGTYRHINCTDAAIEVMRIIHIPEKQGYKVKVSWVNIVNPANHYPCGIVEEIFIPTAKIREWELCLPEQTKAPVLEAISDTSETWRET